ncbi:MAG TPA: hypothetical protein VN132_06310, partial [Bdellovibrio sp.]|nr:hypothetical protein [Bdellovibrio sp.]
ALDILKKVSETAPPKSSIHIDVRSFAVQDSHVTLEGYVNSPQEVTLLQKSLTNITTDGAVKTERSVLGALPGRVAFSFSFNMDRGVQKVTR